MMVYNNTPAAVLALKKSGIKTPADLNGKKLGAPVFDAGRKAWPIFAKANASATSTGRRWTRPLRETMLVRGDVDAITGFSFTSLLNIEARGVKADDVVVLPYPDYGVKLYGNAIIVGEEFLKKNPEAVKAFLRAFTKGMKDVMADPDERDRHPSRQRDGIINEDLEKRRLRLALDAIVLTADARAEGFGEVSAPRLSADGEPGVGRLRDQGPGQRRSMWNGSFLPSAAERNIFARRGSDVLRRLRPRLARLQRELLAEGKFAVEDITMKVGLRASSSPSSGPWASASVSGGGGGGGGGGGVTFSIFVFLTVTYCSQMHSSPPP